MLRAIKDVRVLAIVYGVVGLPLCVQVLAGFHTPDPVALSIFFVCTCLSAVAMRITANAALIPAGFLILLLGFKELSVAELVAIGACGAILREIRSVRRAKDLFGVAYSVATITIGIVTSVWTYQAVGKWGISALFPAPLIAAAATFLFNWGLAAALATDPNAKFTGFYRRECRPLLPWYVAAAYLAYLVGSASTQTGWHPALIATPLLFVFDRGYRMWMQQKAVHKRELDELHRRTLDTLSIAIDSRDHSTQMHLRRVQVFAEGVGKKFGLNEVELESLNIAALLHDIGKLGIPDHILLKPGRLTEEEWEKMKTHPLVGADMLRCMKYPESVVEIVRAHHEKFNGAGYPHGLAGKQIPLGARILTAVDCLDALASERPYRGALSLSAALDQLKDDVGKSFDPKVVEVLERCVPELEAQAREMAAASAKDAQSPQHDLATLATRLLADSQKPNDPFLSPIVSARKETQLLQNLAAELVGARHLEDVVATAMKWAAQIVPCDTQAVYISRDGMTESLGEMQISFPNP
jgi:putative nucleotidyltransferase with HDIG domain